MTEQHYQKKIKEALESKGAKVTKYNANGYGEKGHPDLFASIPIFLADLPNVDIMLALFVEVKKPGGRLSKAQEMKIARMREDGHLVCVATYPEDVWRYLADKGIWL